MNSIERALIVHAHRSGLSAGEVAAAVRRSKAAVRDIINDPRVRPAYIADEAARRSKIIAERDRGYTPTVIAYRLGLPANEVWAVLRIERLIAERVR